MIEFIFFKQSSVLCKIYHIIIDMVQNNFILKRQFFLFSLFLFENLPNIEIFGGSQLTFSVSYDQHLNCEVSSWRGRHFLFSSPGPAGVVSCPPPPPPPPSRHFPSQPHQSSSGYCLLSPVLVFRPIP